MTFDWYSSEVTISLLRKLPPGILHFARTQSIYHIIAKGGEETIRQALAPAEPVVCDLVPLTLEEIFIYELEGLGYDSNVFA